MAERPVYVRGIGLCSYAGKSKEAFFETLCGPERPVEQHLVPLGERNMPLSACLSEKQVAEDFEDAFFQMCRDAIQTALEEAAFSAQGTLILLGSGMGLSEVARLGHSPAQATWRLKSRLEEAFPGVQCWMTANACCAGAQAIAFGMDLVRQGKVRQVVAGGAEGLSLLVAAGFRRLLALDPTGTKPFDHNRKGLHMGDGAAFFALSAVPGQGETYALLGQGTTCDAYHITAPRPDGSDARRAILQALAQAQLTPRQIQGVVAHATGTRRNDPVEAQILSQVFGAIPVTAPKGALGHTGGACGAFGLLTALCCLQYGILPPVWRLKNPEKTMEIKPVMKKPKPIALTRMAVCTFAFGGSNTVLLCGRTQ